MVSNNLFQRGSFKLHSGEISTWKIDCDFLTDEDIETIAMLINEKLPSFGKVEGVPSGGLRLAKAMSKYVSPYHSIFDGTYGATPLLIVDDVFTTGRSMEEHRNGRDALGAVIFARSYTPNWITPLFKLEP